MRAAGEPAEQRAPHRDRLELGVAAPRQPRARPAEQPVGVGEPGILCAGQRLPGLDARDQLRLAPRRVRCTAIEAEVAVAGGLRERILIMLLRESARAGELGDL